MHCINTTRISYNWLTLNTLTGLSPIQYFLFCNFSCLLWYLINWNILQHKYIRKGPQPPDPHPKFSIQSVVKQEQDIDQNCNENSQNTMTKNNNSPISPWKLRASGISKTPRVLLFSTMVWRQVLWGKVMELLLGRPSWVFGWSMFGSNMYLSQTSSLLILSLSTQLRRHRSCRWRWARSSNHNIQMVTISWVTRC